MPNSFLDWLNVLGAMASLLGLAVSLYTLFRVTRLQDELRSRDHASRILTMTIELIDGPKGLTTRLSGRSGITLEEREKAKRIIDHTHLYLSRAVKSQPLLHKTLIELEREIGVNKNRANLVSLLEAFKTELAPR